MKKGVIIAGIIMSFVCSLATAKLTLQNSLNGIDNNVMLNNIESRLDSTKTNIAGTNGLTTAQVKQIYAQGPKQIKQALQPYGYFHSEVSSSLTRAGDTWYATYNITLGPPTIIRSFDIKIYGLGKNDPRFKKFLKNIPIKTGQIFDSPLYKDTKQKLFNIANRRGYFDAKMVQNSVKINLHNRTCDIIMYFNTGPRYKFGAISFSKTKYNQNLINKMVTFKPGQPYSSGQIQRTQQNFHDSDIFANVTIEPQFKHVKNRQVPIFIHIQQKNNFHYLIGAGYGTDTGFRGSLGLDINNIGTLGHHLTGIVKASQKEAGFQASYIIPGTNPATERFDISGGSQMEDYDYGKSTLIKAGPGYTSTFYGWKQTIRLDALYEYWHFNNQPYENTTMVVPSVSWVRHRANNPIRPTKGYRISAIIQGAPYKFANSKVGFAQFFVSGKMLYPIPKGPILVLRGDLGYTAIQNRQKQYLPLSFWYFSGGSQNLRGYRYQNIGPGTQVAEASIELRQRVYQNFYLSVFYDMGNSSEHVFTWGSETLHSLFMHKGAGFGVVWLSPVGSIQLTFARPIDDPHAPAMIQFSMGPEL